MIFFKADKIGFMYENQADYLFKEISFVVDSKSKIGLIGKNGSGKSTILKLLVGILKVDEGFLYKANDIIVGYVNQEFTENLDETAFEFLASGKKELLNLKKIIDNSQNYSDAQIVDAFSKYQELNGFDFERKVEATIEILNLDNSVLDRELRSFSGGEKSKLAFCRLILDNPDIILLDEPTNHLDIDNIKKVESYLLSIKKPYVIVSHDRKFLDNTVTEIWELNQGKLNRFSGNYSFYKNEIEQEKKKKISER